MFKKKECVAMLLAGGQGSRLYALTRNTAKPAVQFGGKYRIIDFTLSNCINSGIDTVGILTQYRPLELNDYIGNGLPWDLDRMYGGVKILPPYQGNEKADWYKGTANAIYQNLEFIDRYRSEYVLILSGDHIYKMDYSEMLGYHIRKGADCTISVIDVPREDAGRFGITETDGEGRIVGFEEKPENPASTKASMGIYIFGREKLEEYLEKDEHDPFSSNDFGKNIIPGMIAGKEKLYAYQFNGYWKDVGTVQSLWEANMDMLGDNPPIDLKDGKCRIFTRHRSVPPQFVGENSEISNCVITEGCEIYGKAENCVVGSGVKIMEGAYVSDSVIMNDVIIDKNAVIYRSVIDSDVFVGSDAGIGGKVGGITVIGRGNDILPKSKIRAGEMIS